jgi:hypothetical protein
MICCILLYSCEDVCVPPNYGGASVFRGIVKSTGYGNLNGSVAQPVQIGSFIEGFDTLLCADLSIWFPVARICIRLSVSIYMRLTFKHY